MMNTRRTILAGCLAVAVLLVIGGFVVIWRPAIAPISPGAGPGADERTFRHGAELAAIGHCNSCHQASGGKPYAGGLALATPFGTIFSSNITPDTETGIGSWSEAAFQRAMHNGVDREGRQLYPAFPYDHFTKATEADVHALYVYLMNQPPVRNTIPANELDFPFSIRPIVAGWKLLFLRTAPVPQDASRTPQWNRGRYLVEGLGLCGSCHTPRNIMGAEEKSRAYAGGAAEGWNAPPLNADSFAARNWTVDQMAQYLSTGWTRWHGAAAGPMADVTRHLAQADSDDVRAMATYIVSLLPQTAAARDGAAAAEKKQVPGASAEVVALFTGACANCHDDGNGVGPSKAVSLALSSAVRQPESANMVRVMLTGVQPPLGAPGAYMPSFDSMLTDRQIALLAEYVRARYTTEPPWTDVRAEIAKARKMRD
jgi:mono/diheme cytochrome c family protein